MLNRWNELVARLVEIAGAIPGIADAERGRSDATGLVRPACVIKAGSQQYLRGRPDSEKLSRFQVMELSPEIRLFNSGTPAQIEEFNLLFHDRFLSAVISDDKIKKLLSVPVGQIRYEGSSNIDTTPEGREGHMEMNIVFEYPLKADDLV